MDSFLYIRVRGRVLAPYDQEKLQSLARRGQLSRIHELSADGASWVRAANYPELFTGAQAEMPAPRGPAIESATAAAITDGMNASPRPQTQQQWHYTSGGVQRGPVDFSNLQLLMGTNQVRPDDLVWCEGMPAWIPASGVPGLANNPRQPPTTGPSMFCRQCGSQIPASAFICMKCGVATGSGGITGGTTAEGHSDKSRIAFIMLGLFLGGLGIHNFYAGYAGKGVAQLLITIFSPFLLFFPLLAVWVWVLIEICTVSHDAQGRRFSS